MSAVRLDLFEEMEVHFGRDLAPWNQVSSGRCGRIASAQVVGSRATTRATEFQQAAQRETSAQQSAEVVHQDECGRSRRHHSVPVAERFWWRRHRASLPVLEADEGVLRRKEVGFGLVKDADVLIIWRESTRSAPFGAERLIGTSGVLTFFRSPFFCTLG